MFAAQLRGTACASLILLGVVLFSFGAVADSLRLSFVSVSEGRDARSGKPTVTIRLTDQSTPRFSQFAQANLGQKMHVLLDGKTMLSPVVREPISGGVFIISMDEPAEAHAVAERLSIPNTVLEVDTVPR